MRELIFALAILTLPLGLWVVQSDGEGSTGNSSRPASPTLTAEAEAGRIAFDAACSGCHGRLAQGTNRGPPLLHADYAPARLDDRAFRRAVREGVRARRWWHGDMPRIEGIAAAQIDRMIRFMREMQRANGIGAAPRSQNPGNRAPRRGGPRAGAIRTRSAAQGGNAARALDRARSCGKAWRDICATIWRNPREQGRPGTAMIHASASSRTEPAAVEAGSFSPAFRAGFDQLLRWRRDVRRFRQDPVPEGLMQRLMAQTVLAPSVGLSQPARFVHLRSMEARRAALANFEAANAQALGGYEGDRARLYAGLKLSGMREAPEQLAVFCDAQTATGAGLGRATMPEMLPYSVVCAVMQLWLAARAEGVGLGWVSILDPERLCRDLSVPQGWRLVAYLCLGWPEEEQEDPELARAGWEERAPEPVVLVR